MLEFRVNEQYPSYSLTILGLSKIQAEQLEVYLSSINERCSCGRLLGNSRQNKKYCSKKCAKKYWQRRKRVKEIAERINR